MATASTVSTTGAASATRGETRRPTQESKRTPAPRREAGGPTADPELDPTADSLACCAPVRSDVLDEAQATVLAASFAALADPIRLRLLSYIAASGADEVCACDLVEPSGRSQPTVSHHMKILVDAGLIEREKRGLWVWYRLVPARLDDLRAVLA